MLNFFFSDLSSSIKLGLGANAMETHKRKISAMREKSSLCQKDYRPNCGVRLIALDLYFDLNFLTTI